ncbi:hypothetical protein PIB30_023846, partial [Stylosanthes scabra]|nr:hypothetical protein [Stylosanthes scabra]
SEVTRRGTGLTDVGSARDRNFIAQGGDSRCRKERNDFKYLRDEDDAVMGWSKGSGNNVHAGGGPKSAQLVDFPGELAVGLTAMTWETSMMVGNRATIVVGLLEGTTQELEGATQELAGMPRKDRRGGVVPFLLIVGSHMGNHYAYDKGDGSTFLPVLGSRSSIKDVSNLKRISRLSSSNDRLSSSPPLGFTGQPSKRPNKIASLIPKRKTTNKSTLLVVKLKRLFCRKNLRAIAYPNTLNCGNWSQPQLESQSQHQSQLTFNSSAKVPIPCQTGGGGNENNIVPRSIENMDPPLPVTKIMNKTEGQVNDSLWKRRSGGVALTNVQLHQIHISKNQL